MAPVHHRRPGPIAAALGDERVSLEIIADGVHIHPALITLVATLAPERLVLVTDTMGLRARPPACTAWARWKCLSQTVAPCWPATLRRSQGASLLWTRPWHSQ